MDFVSTYSLFFYHSFQIIQIPYIQNPFCTDNFYVTSFIYLFFYLKTKDWRLGSTDDIEKIANFMCCLVYTDIFLYVTIFICNINTSTLVFQQI